MRPSEAESGAAPRRPAPGIAVPAIVGGVILLIVLASAASGPRHSGQRGVPFPFPDCMKSCR